MPFDSLTAGAVGAAPDHRCRPNSGIDYEYSRRVAAQLRADAFARLAGRLVLAVAATLLAWHARARDRRLLASMDERMRRDIGISRFDVFQETSKPFWRS